MVTIYDIAKACGFSPTTVSKALNGYSDVKEKTRRLIKQTADEMGYYPNSQAKALIKRKAWNIGVLFQDGENIGITHPLFAEILESFKKVAESHGYDVTFISNKIGDTRLSYLGHCKYRQVDGLVIACTDFYSDEINELLDSDLPIIAIDYSDERVSCVTTDSMAGMTLLYDHLYDLGHRDIVYLHGELTYITLDRIKALKKAAEKRGESFNDEQLIEAKYYSVKTGYSVMKELLQRDERPTAVMVCDDFTALGAINASIDSGLSIPEDISIVGYDGIQISQLLRPRVTTVKQDAEKMGALAAEKLVRLIEQKDEERETLVMLPSIIIGDSCKNKE
ncbi:LacI family DNA-binding transcriptional regulator [Paenibacillus paeoniae]|uniref:LacI family transcriptional regulator n=1 Tax=Paenibacillus paeoniae TaxID=2292705 RepID=A0A371PHN8_9BACL|nr:LacI family DNA-binding transcriptional regulator [Paenibacillus paeoniae]REK75136.1 LacI family transcriptional regulator [Paenibacillus paeoniae]